MGELLQGAVADVLMRWGRRNGAEDTAPDLAPLFARAFEAACREAGADDPDAALRQALTLDEGDAGRRQLADLLDAAIPSALRAARRRIDEDDAPQPAPAPSAREQTVRDGDLAALGEVWDALAPAYETFGETEAEQNSLRRWNLPDIVAHLAFMYAGSTSVGANDPDRARTYRHRVRFEASVDAELSVGLPQRYATAVMIEESFRHWRRAGFSMGRDVHEVLQVRYRLHRHPPNEIVQEATVYSWGRRPRTIVEVVEEEGRRIDTDCVYLVLDLGRLTYRPPADNTKAKLRWDNIDLDTDEIWEIKPAQYLSHAVLQEAFYRNKLNFTVLPFRDAGKYVSTEFLSPGGPDYPLHGATPGDLLIETRYGRLALPFTIVDLPGIVAYIPIDEDNFEKVKRRVRRVVEKVEKAVRAVAELALIAMIVLIVVALVVVIVLVVMLALGLIAPSPQPGPPPLLPPPGGGDKVDPIKDPVRDPIRQPAGALSLRRLPARPGEGLRLLLEGVDGATTSLDLGAVHVAGLPPAAAGELLGRTGAALTAFLDGFDPAGAGPRRES